MSYQNFTSLPPELEQTFVVYEQHTAESQKKAWTVGWIAAAAVFLVIVAIKFGIEPDKKDLSKGMNMSNLSTKRNADK
ncbi:MAG: hypothetical protein KA297_01170 [Kofleriaceae bacterium]|jgi:hypothetical protein|nr:hypothetical protein [Kofleriaceae bacterium]MBP6836687.1 hypothetical protein [Kofleriaceae bacterium]